MPILAGVNGSALYFPYTVSVHLSRSYPCGSGPSPNYKPDLIYAKGKCSNEFLKGRVLCSEDDPDSRELIVLVLKGSGYEVVCTDTGTEALDLAKKERFDLFLVDSWMPGLTGPDLTRLIREFDRTTPILFYSAAAFESDMQLAFEAGAQGYLTKALWY